jgi:uncharacterized Zn finger protein/DNA-binding XRE family transcriptional regulator
MRNCSGSLPWISNGQAYKERAMGWYDDYYPRYVSVGERRAQAAKKIEKLRKRGVELRPVEIPGRKIAQTFWGKAWCEHLEKFSDYENRLPRGRSYVRGGLVCHLEIDKGKVRAMVAGTSIYNVEVAIKTLPGKKWARLREQCEGRIGSLLELLQGRISRAVMEVMTDRDRGLFPLPKEIEFECDCPDWAVMCKHVAATLYAVGARLDESPELIFLLRGVDHLDLIGSDAELVENVTAGKKGSRKRIADTELGRVFGIEMAETEEAAPGRSPKRKSRKAPSRPGKRKPTPLRRSVSVPARTRKRKKNATDREKPLRRPATTAKKPPTFTGAGVAKLRRELKLPRSRFAELLGVSPATVANWERTRGKLNLHLRTHRALAQTAAGKKHRQPKGR